MGIEHRLTGLRRGTCFALGVACLLGASSGCHRKSQDDERRRAVLKPVDLHDKERELYEKMRLYDDQGNLLASDVKVAGMNLPRGMTQTFVLEREWYFDGPIPPNKVDAYLHAHLEIGQISWPSNNTVEYAMSKVKDTPDSPPVLVRLFPSPGRGGSVRLYIRQAAPAPTHWPSEAEVQAQMALRQQHSE
ncbi:MAG TPA: hypothetical protein VHM19_00865 [Polyangiales bacterium]|jgi:hypothetical protein|nr:hypothetical protein [Polyangiales bacterium]